MVIRDIGIQLSRSWSPVMHMQTPGDEYHLYLLILLQTMGTGQAFYDMQSHSKAVFLGSNVGTVSVQIGLLIR